MHKEREIISHVGREISNITNHYAREKPRKEIHRKKSLKNFREWFGWSNNELFKAKVLKSKNLPDDCQPTLVSKV